LGLTEIAILTFTYVELPALIQHTVTMPVHVNVVPG
jgi:Ca-activated chloride channel family protein